MAPIEMTTKWEVRINTSISTTYGYSRFDELAHPLLQQFDMNLVERSGKERRGFASMSAEKQREIASKGGRAAHAKGTAHEWSSDEARNAGRKGGMASRGGRGKLPHPPVDDLR